LIVRDIKSSDVVGTYRMMRRVRACQHLGFYSEKEFDLSQIKKLEGEPLELGRSCARKDFRDRTLLPLMWEAIVEHVRAHQVRYLFGCGSLLRRMLLKSAPFLPSSKTNITRLTIAESSP
jgi:putative hemolysin